MAKRKSQNIFKLKRKIQRKEKGKKEKLWSPQNPMEVYLLLILFTQVIILGKQDIFSIGLKDCQALHENSWVICIHNQILLIYKVLHTICGP